MPLYFHTEFNICLKTGSTALENDVCHTTSETAVCLNYVLFVNSCPLDRNVRIEKMTADIKELEKQNEKLRRQDDALRREYDKVFMFNL